MRFLSPFALPTRALAVLVASVLGSATSTGASEVALERDVAGPIPTPRATERGARPNIVLILADDFGYELVGANGGSSYSTPNLDRLAREGVRFTSCHALPLCTPSRVQLLTGLYGQRNYLAFGVLEPRARTIAAMLRDAGYSTCVAGKWQLGGGPRAPDFFGFDEHLLWQLTVRKSRYANPVLERNGHTIEFRDGEYGPDLVSDFIVDFIRRRRDEPFFVFYPMLLTHAPFVPTPASERPKPDERGDAAGVDGDAADESKSDPRFFPDMVSYADRVVGKITRALEELGLSERTLVLFAGDNGTARAIRSRLGGREVRGGKGTTSDAGTHVPLIAWGAHVEARGAVVDGLVDFSDFVPTILEAVGRADFEGNFDGRSFLPRLRGEKSVPREWIYGWYARDGGLKGIEWARSLQHRLYDDGRLFDVVLDPEERRDLAGTALAAEALADVERLRAALVLYRGTRVVPRARRQVPTGDDIAAIERIIEERGGHLFRKVEAQVEREKQRVVEVVLNRSRVRDADLAHVGRLAELTDLSLEETEIGDAGIEELGDLLELEWLNLYRTRVGDAGARMLAGLPRLVSLPIGGTRITDLGLRELGKIRRLAYLGLRGNRISDAGLAALAPFERLTGLQLAETPISDAGIEHVARLRRLEKLWLDDTAITDAAVPALSRLPSLRELWVRRTKLTASGLVALRAALPDCRVIETDE
jgi:arylsulfatase A